MQGTCHTFVVIKEQNCGNFQYIWVIDCQATSFALTIKRNILILTKIWTQCLV